jgi:hypothetical protein
MSQAPNIDGVLIQWGDRFRGLVVAALADGTARRLHAPILARGSHDPGVRED